MDEDYLDVDEIDNIIGGVTFNDDDDNEMIFKEEKDDLESSSSSSSLLLDKNKKQESSSTTTTMSGTKISKTVGKGVAAVATKGMLKTVFDKQYVMDKLNQSIKMMNVEMLIEAINMAKGTILENTTMFKNAQTILENEQRKSMLLLNIENELYKSTSIPKLLSRVDRLLELVNEALSHGLGAERVVSDTLAHLQSIQTLIQLRNKIRISVELCSEKEMESAMNEREKLLKIYGSDLCAEEADAVYSMRKMISFERISYKNKESRDGGGKEGEGEGEGEGEERDSNSNSNGDDNDIKLPMFVCKQLELMRNSKNNVELEEATRNFTILVPNNATRRCYIRAFKWVVAFAFWKFPKRVDLNEQQQDQNQQQHQQQQTSPSPSSTPSKLQKWKNRTTF